MELGILEILKILPHRYPFLFVDRVIAFEKEKSITGIKNVTFNEEFFQGHFPGNPVMPGVLIVEALAQLAGVGYHLSFPGGTNRLMYLSGVDRARFRRPVVPGDQLRMDFEYTRIKPSMVKGRGTARVGSDVCAEAEIFSVGVEGK